MELVSLDIVKSPRFCHFRSFLVLKELTATKGFKINFSDKKLSQRKVRRDSLIVLALKKMPSVPRCVILIVREGIMNPGVLACQYLAQLWPLIITKT